MKKQKQDPKEQLEEYIQFLVKQIDWKSNHPERCLVQGEVEKMKYQLSKARLRLKLMN